MSDGGETGLNLPPKMILKKTASNSNSNPFSLSEPGVVISLSLSETQSSSSFLMGCGGNTEISVSSVNSVNSFFSK